jgi:hypothetical protein
MEAYHHRGTGELHNTDAVPEGIPEELQEIG